MSTADLVLKAQAVAPELAKYDHLPPLRSIAFHDHGVVLYVDGPYKGLSTLASLAMWAREFDVPIKVALSWFSDAEIDTVFVLGETPVRMTTSIGTAQAYLFGGVLGKPLTKDEPLVLTADELLDGIAKIAPAATS